MLGIVADMGMPAIEGTHLAGLALKVATFAALERFGRKVDKIIGPDLQPVALPRRHCRFASLLLHSLAAHTALHCGCRLG